MSAIRKSNNRASIIFGGGPKRSGSVELPVSFGPVDNTPVPLSQAKRCKLLGFPFPKSSNLNLTIVNMISPNEVSRQFRFTYTSKVKEVIKKVKSEKEYLRTSTTVGSDAYADDEVKGNQLIGAPQPLSEVAYGLFIPADKESLIPSDEVKLDDEYMLYMYDLAPVQTLLWKEIPTGLHFHHYIYLKIVVELGSHQTSVAIKFHRKFTVKDAIALIEQRIPSINKNNNISYGLYAHMVSPADEEGGILIMMDADRTLESYGLSLMDILEFKAIAVYEFAFLTSQTGIEHPETLSLPESMKTRELIELIAGYILKDKQLPLSNFGFLYIPTKNVEMTSFNWMEESRSIGDYAPQQYDILEFKKRVPEQTGSVTSTLDVNHDIPSTKLILVSGPIYPDNRSAAPTSNSQRDDISLESGERIVYEEDHVALFSPHLLHKTLWGSLIITNYQMLFLPNEQVDPLYANFFRVPVASINKLDKIGNQKDSLDIYCKDIRTVTFEFLAGRETRRNVVQALDQVACFSHPTKSFAYSFNPLKFQSSRFMASKHNGWNIYNIEEEYKRLFQNISKPSWRISEVNNEYKMSDTYPSQMIVPSTVSDEILKVVSTYRSKGRIPSLSWIHPFNSASITRSSQPLVSLKRNRCVEDEYLLNVIREMTGTSNQFLYIYDARPRANAMANVAVGGGFENTNFYSNTVLEFLNIANIHVMRESLQKLQSINTQSSNWLSQLESTGWLEYIRLLLEGSCKMIDTIQNGASILCHCSDGWDRTAQFCSIVQLCLDPYSRTIIGFESLIEKDWVSFGHKFTERIGHGRLGGDEEQRSPVFIQFLDCVYQLICQFPCSFEFNEDLLISIADHLYSCKFGTFLFNNEKERNENQVKTKTVSLWTHINAEIDNYINTFYVNSNSPLRPSCSMEDIVYWKGYYSRYQKKRVSVMTKEIRAKMLQNTIQNSNEKLKDFEQMKSDLEKEIEKLKEKLKLSGNDVENVVNGEENDVKSNSVINVSQNVEQQQVTNDVQSESVQNS